jgi:Xaa-Pro dipeptidase
MVPRKIRRFRPSIFPAKGERMLLNRSRALEIMEKNDLVALVATAPENVAYLTGFWVLTHWRHRGRQVYAILSRDDGNADLVISRGLVDHPLQGGTWVRRYYLYGEFFFAPTPLEAIDSESRALFQSLGKAPHHPTALDALLHCLRDRKIEKGRIGVDQGGDLVFLGNSLVQAMPALEPVPAYELFRQIRLIKTSEEIRRIQEATRIAEEALTAAIQAIAEGVREKELDLIFKERVIQKGGYPTLSWIGAGPRGAFPNVEPSDRKIRPGDAVRFDVGCIYQAYHADIARTAVLGKPSAKQRQYHDALVAGEERLLEAFRPGAAVADLFRMGMEEVRAKGIPHYQRHHLGHGTGIEGYDPPLLTGNSPLRLEPGMVFCVETPYYEPGFGGLHIEDIVAVTAEGCRLLTQMDRRLFVIPEGG